MQRFLYVTYNSFFTRYVPVWRWRPYSGVNTKSGTTVQERIRRLPLLAPIEPEISSQLPERIRRMWNRIAPGAAEADQLQRAHDRWTTVIDTTLRVRESVSGG